MKVDRAALKLTAILMSGAIIVGCASIIVAKYSYHDPGFPRDITHAKPTGKFSKRADDILVGNNGWSQEFIMNGEPKHYCEELPFHKGMILDNVITEVRIEDDGRECLSFLDDRAGYVIRSEPNGKSITVEEAKK